jgi:hypothetical protein
MAASTELNIILRDARKCALLRMTQQIKLDTISLICPSCQCVAAVELDREGKSAAYFLPSRTHEEGRFAIVTDVGRGERWTRRLRLTSVA